MLHHMKGNNAILKQYSFSYDNANRLLTATFADAGKYNTHYSYDKNGNIKTLERTGELGGSNTYNLIDNPTYDYTGNQLKYVNDMDNGDGNHQNNGFTDNGSFLTTNEYFYDQNGNLIQDLNKKIFDINYNHLNLPQHISIGTYASFNSVDFLYTADGVKLQKSIAGGGARSAPTDYLGSIVYPGEASAFIFTPEGRALRNDEGNFDYEYFLRDHLGNTRVSFNQKGTLLQDNSYYPFGMSLGEALTYMDNTTSENKYKYNGKELQDDFGLMWYHYGTRNYDPQLGRWHVVDPNAESYFAYGPYLYVGNNPIRRIDPDGNDGWDVVLGFSAAVVDNATGGFTNVRTRAAKYVTDAKDFNSGQDKGDAASIAIGAMEFIGGQSLESGGTATVAVSLLAEGPTSGTSTVGVIAGGAAVVEGEALKLHGTIMMGSGVGNLASGKGRLNEGDTESDNGNQALNKAKQIEGIPQSQQPDKTIKANTPEGAEMGLDPKKNVKQFEYTNSQGQKKSIRQDKAVQYKDGGSQGTHYNSGNSGQKLEKHHYYGNGN